MNLTCNFNDCPNPVPDPASDEINLDITCLTQNPLQGTGFANIQYSSLTAQEKATVDAFVTLVKTKCVV